MGAATAWGSPSLPRRALCLHGLSGGSTTWYRVADRLVSAGYFVLAPDLLGHGLAQRAPEDDWSLHALTEALRPYITPPPDVIIAHSLGGTLALKLLPFLPEGRPVHVVLVDPALEVGDGKVKASAERRAVEAQKPPTIEEYMAENPGWSRQDAVIKQYIAHLCNPDAVRKIVQHTCPWSYTSLLPALSKTTSLTIIAADPAMGALFTADQVSALNKTHPHIRVVTAKGATHSVQRDSPDLVADIALGAEE